MAEEKSSNSFVSWYFIVQWSGCLIGWNALLNSLDFFDRHFGDKSTYFKFPLAFMIPLLLTPILFIYFYKRLKSRKQLQTFLVVQIILVAILPLLAFLFGPILIGIIFVYIDLVLLGITSVVVQSAIMGFSSSFKGQNQAENSTGYAVSGIILNVVRVISLLMIPSNEDQRFKNIMLFYLFVVILLAVVYFFHDRFIKSEHVKNVSLAGGESNLDVTSNDEENDSLIVNDGADKNPNDGEAGNGQEAAKNRPPPPKKKKEDAPANNEENKINIDDDNEDTDANKIEFWSTFWRMWKLSVDLGWYSIGALVICIQTFMVFPGLAFLKPVESVDDHWKLLIFLFSYNLGELLGGFASKSEKLRTNSMLTLLTLVRFSFVILMALQVILKDVNLLNTIMFAITNLFLLGATHGFLSRTFYLKAPQKVPITKKVLSGYTLASYHNIGTAIGLWIGLVFQRLGTGDADQSSGEQSS